MKTTQLRSACTIWQQTTVDALAAVVLTLEVATQRSKIRQISSKIETTQNLTALEKARFRRNLLDFS